ncbi:MAG: hypothetical protein PHU71_03595 [Candidatus Gracilibacteria bacterium]|nr:hypothetical protein [Candidatus Gracilibacteria bacterium]
MARKLEDKTIKDFFAEHQIDPHAVRSLSLNVLTKTGKLKYTRHYSPEEIDLERQLRVYANGSFEDETSVTTDEGSTTISTGLRGKFFAKKALKNTD